MVDANTLETTLKAAQWVGGQSPTVADKEAFEGMKGQNISAETHPNVFAWFFLVSKFSDDIMKSWPAAGAAAAGGKNAAAKGGKGGKKAAAKKEEDDDMDLFGDDNEEDAAAAAAVAAAAKAKATAAAKPKKVVIAMSIVMLEVKPLDDLVDLDALAKKLIAEVTMEGLYWKTDYKKEPVAFGIFKLIVGFSLEDAKVSVDDIVEKIEAYEELVQSVEIAVFNKI
jgi:elongation factor 1-beta